MTALRPPAFLARRWRGEVPLRTVLWRDTLGVGTAINLLATFTAMVALGLGAPAWAGAALHFAPLPYNVFLFTAVGRAAPKSRGAVALALAWLLAMIVV